MTTSGSWVGGGSRRWGPYLLYALALTALYWPVVSKHYVWDDWAVYHDVWTQGALSFLAKVWNPVGVLLYRPLAQTIFLVFFSLFGLFSIPGNITRLVLHFTNALFVARVSRKLGTDDDAGLLAGFLYVSLATLHIDPLLWLVGLYDIAVVTFSLAAIDRFLDNRLLPSLVLTTCALLTKEAGAFLPPLLLAWAIIERRPRAYRVGFAGLIFAYGILKLLGVSPFAVSASNAHAMTFSPERGVVVFQEYLTWLASAFVPFAGSLLAGYLVLAESLALGALWWLLRRRLSGGVSSVVPLILLLWCLVALLPALPLLHQSTRYAVVHAAAPLCILLPIMISEISASLVPRRRRVILATAAGIVLSANFFFTMTTFSQGLHQQTRDDGWFHLVRRSAAVDSVYEHLFARNPTIPSGSCIRIVGIPLEAVGDSAAVQLWYRDRSLTVVEGLDTLFTGLNSGDHVRVEVIPPVGELPAPTGLRK